jgi:hypothetical protein
MKTKLAHDGKQAEMNTVNTNDGEMVRVDRRQALKLFGFGLTSVGGLIALAGCSKGGEQAAAPAPAAAAPPATGGLCQFRVPVDEAAKQMRRNLQYREKSDDPNKHCSLCSQFEQGKYGDCGGCKLFAGGVSPGGVCLSFAPLGKPAVPGAAAAPAPGKQG